MCLVAPTTTCNSNGTVTPVNERTCIIIPPEGSLNSAGEDRAQALEACKQRCSNPRRAGNYAPESGEYYTGPISRENGECDKHKGPCNYWPRCNALNVVPLQPPRDLTFPDQQNIPWGVGGAHLAREWRCEQHYRVGEGHRAEFGKVGDKKNMARIIEQN